MDDDLLVFLGALFGGLPGDEVLSAGPRGVLDAEPDELEAELERRLDDGGASIDVTPALWNDLRKRIDRHRTLRTGE